MRRSTSHGGLTTRFIKIEIVNSSSITYVIQIFMKVFLLDWSRPFPIVMDGNLLITALYTSAYVVNEFCHCVGLFGTICGDEVYGVKYLEWRLLQGWLDWFVRFEHLQNFRKQQEIPSQQSRCIHRWPSPDQTLCGHRMGGWAETENSILKCWYSATAGSFCLWAPTMGSDLHGGLTVAADWQVKPLICCDCRSVSTTTAASDQIAISPGIEWCLIVDALGRMFHHCKCTEMRLPNDVGAGIN